MSVYRRCTTQTKFQLGMGSVAVFRSFDRLKNWLELETLCNRAEQRPNETLNLWVHGSSPWRVTIKLRRQILLRARVTQSCRAHRAWVTHGSHRYGGTAWNSLRPA